MAVAPPGPVDVILRDASLRATSSTYRLQSVTVLDLLVEAVDLAKLLATEERDLLVIRSEYEHRAATLANEHATNVLLIDHDYEERKIQTEALNKAAHLFIKEGQHEIAQQIMNRLADILASSPLDKLLNSRKST